MVGDASITRAHLGTICHMFIVKNMSRRHVIFDVEEKGLDPKIAHTDIYRGRLVPTADASSKKIETQEDQKAAEHSAVDHRSGWVDLSTENVLQASKTEQKVQPTGRRKKQSKRDTAAVKALHDDRTVD